MKILQWNVWYKEDINNILKVIREINPDIICLQELTVNHPHYNNAGIHTPEYLATELNYYYIYQPAEHRLLDGEKMNFGNGIFSRYHITDSTHAYIQEKPEDDRELNYARENRIYLEAIVKSPTGDFTIGTTHMSYTDCFLITQEKKSESDKLLEILKQKSNRYVFTGDLNALPNSYTINEIEKYLQHAGPPLEEKTWTTKPFLYNGFEAKTLDWRLDYCFVTPDVAVTSAEIIKTEFSDHLPILLEIENPT